MTHNPKESICPHNNTPKQPTFYVRKSVLLKFLFAIFFIGLMFFVYWAISFLFLCLTDVLSYYFGLSPEFSWGVIRIKAVVPGGLATILALIYFATTEMGRAHFARAIDIEYALRGSRFWRE